ncbi:MAG: glycosyltransferase family 2 protein [Leptolyngbyaceae cyanobacterium]
MSSLSVFWGAISLGLLTLQLPAILLLLARLMKGATRTPPIQPKLSSDDQSLKQAPPQELKGLHYSPPLAPKVSVVVPTLNEAHRIGPCLAGLSQQGPEVVEILVVDSRSTDGTQALVDAIAQQDSRIRLITDDPLPPGWVGRPWALHTGFLRSHPRSDWVLGVDADTFPQPGLVASLLAEAERQEYDIVSLSPRFKLETPGEWWLQPALLMTLIYRFDSAGVLESEPERVMANGQCFLSQRSVLAQLDGYSCAASSFCDDVTLAREAARQGFRVGFLDGADVISVRMYEGIADTWNGWGRSLDLKDAASPGQQWQDLWLLVATQGAPLPLLGLLGLAWEVGAETPMLAGAIALNGFLVLIRLGMQVAIANSYEWPQQRFSPALCFWLAPFADPAAVVRIALSTFQRSIQWRGRVYRK